MKPFQSLLGSKTSGDLLSAVLAGTNGPVNVAGESLSRLCPGPVDATNWLPQSWAEPGQHAKAGRRAIPSAMPLGRGPDFLEKVDRLQCLVAEIDGDVLEDLFTSGVRRAFRPALGGPSGKEAHQATR